MTSYQESLRRLQPIVSPIFDAFQHGLRIADEQHQSRNLHRGTDESYFSYTVRREACERLKTSGLLVTLDDGDRSINGLSGIQIAHAGIVLWVFRAQDAMVPLPTSESKQQFYAQGTLDGTDNQLLLWRDSDGVLDDPMTLVRPSGGNHLRRNLQVDWKGPFSRRIAAMQASDLDMLQPTEQQVRLGDDQRA